MLTIQQQIERRFIETQAQRATKEQLIGLYLDAVELCFRQHNATKAIAHAYVGLCLDTGETDRIPEPWSVEPAQEGV